MARLLFTLWPFPTHVRPNLAVAHALRNRGHEIAMYTDASVAPLLESEGFRCLPFRQVDWKSIQDITGRLMDSTGRAGELRLWRKFLLDSIPGQLADLDSYGSEYRPDAMICDMALWGPFLIWQEERHVPAAILCHVANCLLRGTAERGPLVGGSGARSGRNTFQNRAKALLASLPAELISGHFRRIANRFRAQRGLPPISVPVTEYGGKLPLYLIPSAPAFDYNRKNLPKPVHYIGPCLWDKPLGQSAPAWLGEIRAPYILVEEGGLFSNRSPLLRHAAIAIGALQTPGIVLLGDGRKPGSVQFDHLPSNVQVKPWTPLSDVLPRAALVVTNGNSESVLAALQSGVPLVVVPSIWDQLEMARHVEDVGAGVRIPQRKCTPERLRAAIETVRTDTRYRANAERIGSQLAAQGGPARAAELIEKTLL